MKPFVNDYNWKEIKQKNWFESNDKSIADNIQFAENDKEEIKTGVCFKA